MQNVHTKKKKNSKNPNITLVYKIKLLSVPSAIKTLLCITTLKVFPFGLETLYKLRDKTHEQKH